MHVFNTPIVEKFVCNALFILMRFITWAISVRDDLRVEPKASNVAAIDVLYK